MDARETIYDILRKLNRKRHIPDLHSFRAVVDAGVVFVECVGHDEFMIESRLYDPDNHETVDVSYGNAEYLSDLLLTLKIDIDTISQ